MYCVTATADEAPCSPTGDGGASNLRELSTFDELDRLLTARAWNVGPAGGTGALTDMAEYTYDALDRTVQEIESHPQAGVTNRTSTFSFLGLTDLVTQEQQTETTSMTTKDFTYDAYGHRVGMTNTTEDLNPNTNDQTSESFSYAYDVHGSTSLLLDDDGSDVRATYGYTPYGQLDEALSQGDDEETAATKTDPLNPFRYSAKRWDSGTGSIDMGARDFSASAASFIQRDQYMGALSDLGLSSDPITANRYSLAGGNPISYIEWDGHAADANGVGGAYEPQNGKEAIIRAIRISAASNPDGPEEAESPGVRVYSVNDVKARTFANVAAGASDRTFDVAERGINILSPWEDVDLPDIGEPFDSGALPNSYEGGRFGVDWLIGGGVAKGAGAVFRGVSVLARAAGLVRGGRAATLSGRTVLGGAWDEAIRAARRVKSEPGFHDVVGHGTPTSMMDDIGREMLPAEVATTIRNTRSWAGQNIRLLSCSTGCPSGKFAQGLADELGVAVKAPTTDFFVNSRGVPILDKGGSWVTYLPRGQ